ncbi:MAG: diguanylate cyclase [Candidatus Omnitrophota bacterium]
MNQKILIVEDTISDLLFLQKTLEKEQYEVLYADRALKALHMLEKESPDLIILDILLPDIDGFELCRRIRQNELYINTPIIFYSNVKAIDEKLIALEMGASDFISKTADIRELMFRIKNLLKAKKNIDNVLESSLFDNVTNIYNKKYFLNRLNDECSRSKRYGRIFSCAILDIDNLKLLNREFGNDTERLALKKIASLLQNNIREADEVCYYERDLFGLLLPETNKEGAYIAVERIRKNVLFSDEITEESFKDLTISCGISSFENETTQPDKVLEQAITALSFAKKNGKNQTKLFTA